MRIYLILSIMFLLTINAASASVAGAGISDTDSSMLPQTGQVGSGSGGSIQANLLSGGTQPAGALTYSIQSPSVQPLQYAPAGSGAGAYTQGESTIARAPQISGPIEEDLTAERLGLPLPQMDSFTPDSSLGFVSVSSFSGSAQTTLYRSPSSVRGSDRPVASSAPSNQLSPMVQIPARSTAQTAATDSSAWYYPSSIASANRFYVQTSSGLRTNGGCGLGGYLPLWADIRASGNFFVYEWYPGQSVPYVQWLGWTGAGWKKGWFGGDTPGWHILCYNSGFWSNYVYIYVYPLYVSSGQPGYSSSTSVQSAVTAATLVAPTPPSPGGEGLIMPDFNLYRPAVQPAESYGYPGGSGSSVLLAASRPPGSQDVINPAVSGGGGSGAGIINPASPGIPGQSAGPATGFAGSATLISGVSSSPYEASFPASAASFGSTPPAGYMAHGLNPVFPQPAVCKCNEYYVQSCPGELETVAGVFCGEWLPLWSKISRPGVYWSFEWKTCGSFGNPFCSPEVRNFGYKGAGWYRTWFRGDDLGWHILSYHSSDWSNYIYIYVWPED